MNTDRQETSLEQGTAKQIRVDNFFKQICFRRFSGNDELIPDFRRSYRESTLANIEVFLNKNVVWKRVI